MCTQDTAVSVAIMRYISVEPMNTELQLRPKLLRRIAPPRKSVTSKSFLFLHCIIYETVFSDATMFLCVLLGTMPFIKKFMTGLI